MNKIKGQILILMAVFLSFMNIAQAEYKEVYINANGIKITENGYVKDISKENPSQLLKLNLLLQLRNNLSVINSDPNYNVRVVYDGVSIKKYENGILTSTNLIKGKRNDSDNDNDGFAPEANPNNYSLKSYSQTADETQVNTDESDNSIKYDVFDVKKSTFNDDVKRNCIEKERDGLSTYYKCSNEQSVILSDSVLFSKKTIDMNEFPLRLSDVNYSYIIYGLLLLLLLIIL